MTQSKYSHPAWRHAAAGCLVLSLSLAGMKTAQAANSPAVTPQTIYDSGSYPAGLVYGPDQSLWVTLSGTGQIGQISGLGSLLHPLPDLAAHPWDIIIGADQALWFSEEAGDRIGRLAADGELSEFALGEGDRSPTAVALGQDLALWFTQRDGNRIGRLTTGGDLTEFELPHANSKPMGISSAPNGDLWFTEWSNRIGRISLQGELSEFAIPNPPAQPVDLVVDRDGNIWIIFNSGKTIARFNPQTEAFDQYALATQSTSLSDLALGPDDRIWFVGTQTVGSFELEAGIPANVAEEALASPVYSYQGQSQIIAGPDNDLFFTTANTSAVYRSALTGDPVLRDLQVFITYQPPLLLSAGPFNIDAEIVNWTKTDATDVEINLTLDESIHFVSADLPGGSCVDHGLSVQCTLPSLGAGATLPVSFVMTTDRISVSPSPRTLILDAASAEGDYQPANNRVVLFTTIQTSLDYFNDFSDGADEHWSDPVTSTPVEGLDVLGLFDNDDVIFNWAVLPPHDRTWLCFDLYVMGPWNGSQYLNPDETTIIGPDLWTNYIDDHRLLLTTFSNNPQYRQAYPANYPESLFSYQTRAFSTGEYDGSPAVRDARYHFCYQLEHANLALNLLFKGLNLNESAHETWAIDNVRIKILYDASIDRTYLPLLLR